MFQNSYLVKFNKNAKTSTEFPSFVTVMAHYAPSTSKCKQGILRKIKVKFNYIRILFKLH